MIYMLIAVLAVGHTVLPWWWTALFASWMGWKSEAAKIKLWQVLFASFFVWTLSAWIQDYRLQATVSESLSQFVFRMTSHIDLEQLKNNAPMPTEPYLKGGFYLPAFVFYLLSGIAGTIIAGMYFFIAKLCSQVVGPKPHPALRPKG